jgi:hypothetical protein
MGLLETIGNQMGGTILEGVTKLITIWKVPAEKVLEAQQEQDKIVADLQNKILDMAEKEAQGQVDLNKLDAASPRLFNSGWRPAVGWVCASAFAIQYVIGPMATWTASMFGKIVHFPSMDMDTLLPLLFGMLGLGGYRTFEKLKGVAGK